MTTPAPEPPPEKSNGLTAERYVRLRSIPARRTDSILRALAAAEIACYTTRPADSSSSERDLLVDADKRDEAHQVVATVTSTTTGERVSIDADDVDTRFADLISTLDDPEQRASLPATRRGPRDSVGHFFDEFEEDPTYVPPDPEPLPKPTRKVVIGVLLMIAGGVALFAPDSLPFGSTASFVIGAILMLSGVVWLVTQLRQHPEDPFDDGARV